MPIKPCSIIHIQLAFWWHRLRLPRKLLTLFLEKSWPRFINWPSHGSCDGVRKSRTLPGWIACNERNRLLYCWFFAACLLLSLFQKSIRNDITPILRSVYYFNTLYHHRHCDSPISDENHASNINIIADRYSGFLQ